MESPTRLNPSRRRRIALAALVPAVAALLMWALESGHWLVIYNDSNETLAEISLRSGPERWLVRELEPRESRRLQVRELAPAELIVEIAAWAPEPPFRALFDWRHAAITTLRLDSSHVITTTSERGFWQRWLDW